MRGMQGLFCGCWLLAMVCSDVSVAGQLRAGAAQVDVTPIEFPVIVNGMVEERTAERAADVLMSRALVLDDGAMRLAIVVVDSLMLSRELLDDAKQQASQLTGIPEERMLISATHTHSAPSAMPCLGSRVDPRYAEFLPGQIVRSIVQANERLEPVEAGWAVVTDDVHNHCRRWIFRADRMSMTDPFGVQNVRAHMHPGYQSANHVGPAGPADTDLTVLGLRSRDGRPLAVLANYAMHYYGSPLVSADFCGRFGQRFAELIGATDQARGFVGLMSQGTSGDSMWPDYSRPAGRNDLDQYVTEVAERAAEAWRGIRWRSDMDLAMSEEKLLLQRRVPDAARLEWARRLSAEVGERLPRGWSEVYSFEQLYLHEEPQRELKLQAIRIGDLGITALPNEVFGITGLKLKHSSPLAATMNIELANGAEGYIPPPEQHVLGGYTTWPARTAGLEVQAEPQITAVLTRLLEQVSGSSAKPFTDEQHAYAGAVKHSLPWAYWRLGELAGVPVSERVTDGWKVADSASVQRPGRAAIYEPGVAFYLPGPRGAGLQSGVRGNRAVQFAGGRVRAGGQDLPADYTVECWVWNGYPISDRAVTGYFFSRGPAGDAAAAGDHLGIGGNYENAGNDGRLILFNGNKAGGLLAGRTVLQPRTWHHVVFARQGSRVTVWLDGAEQPEIDGELAATFGADDELFLGGRSDGLYGLEGRLDEFAVYDRVLTAADAGTHYRAAQAEHGEQISERVPRPDSEPVSPQESLSLIEVREGYEVQLVAAEPLVQDPVAIDWGVDGRLWVAEMADYPSGMDGNGVAGGRIRVLQDTNGDGQYDSSRVFLDNVAFPNGVLAWGQGVLVTAAPEIFYAADSDGDGVADIRQTLFLGFLEGNQQLRVNGLRWGLDGWVYCAIGSHHPGYGADSKIASLRTGQVVEIGSRDFRFRPETGEIEPQSGPSQFGRNRDAWGNWFGEQNSFPLWHYVLEDGAIRRNPNFAAPNPRHLLTESNPRVWPAAVAEKRYHSFEQAGRFTSACSGMVYLDELLFGSEFQHAFTCEPFSNLVQHNRLIEDGATFRLERDPGEVDAKADFFASRDRWCRPVMVRTGPEGALWVVDMYRYMIEHPQWLPKEGQDELRPFFRSGDDRGRIYRVVPRGAAVQPPAFLKGAGLSGATVTADELVRQLESSNGWVRDAAQRLLVERRPEGAAALLRKLLQEGQSATARLHALCTLGELQQLQSADLRTGLADEHAGVRRWAVRLGGQAGLLGGELAVLKELVTDPSMKVRLELATAAGGLEGRAAAGILSGLLLGTEDSWVQAAVLSSLNSGNAVLVAAAVAERGRGQQLESLGQQAVALGAAAEVAGLLLSAASEGGVEAGLRRRELLVGMLQRVSQDPARLQQLLAAEGKLSGALLMALDRASQEASGELPASNRPLAVRLMLLDPELERRQAVIERLLSPQTEAALQVLVVEGLASRGYAGAGQLLLSRWNSLTPAVRRAAFQAIAGRRGWIELLVQHLESGEISAGEVDAAQRQRLLAGAGDGLKGRLERLFAAGLGDRRSALEAAQPVLGLAGNAERGAVVFGKRCAACHRQNGVGHEVGPNLASLTSRDPALLLSAILDPSGAVEAKYLNFVAVTESGRSAAGMLTTETATGLTFMAAEGRTETLLRAEIEELRSTGKSLMPEGLEKELSQQDLADVIEFVRGLGKG
ncbi:MAG: PVC-type heme-binding CxxCH protein [Planctomycetaceae bacterium]